MGVKAIVAKFLREELVSIGIRSLTISESEKITARIFERIAKLEFDVAAHDVIAVVRDRD
ncbi:hypothetical protein JQ599_30735 [Bradyrhizobium diazoefficiens]|nr:hypothetical protein [Bradyrhizobium diazoefficiens]MBR0704319.1 hypothetical protein [Bradyrhizobium diazoefficiens]MBR0772757.1 hypothetical protein [Bradyrhizobium diazoefficiens]